MEKEQGFPLKFMLVGAFIFILLVIGGIMVLGKQDQSQNASPQSNTGQLQLGDTSLGNSLSNNSSNSQVNINNNGSYVAFRLIIHRIGKNPVLTCLFLKNRFLK
jgi:hypothetical protein